MYPLCVVVQVKAATPPVVSPVLSNQHPHPDRHIPPDFHNLLHTISNQHLKQDSWDYLPDPFSLGLWQPLPCSICNTAAHPICNFRSSLVTYTSFQYTYIKLLCTGFFTNSHPRPFHQSHPNISAMTSHTTNSLLNFAYIPLLCIDHVLKLVLLLSFQREHPWFIHPLKLSFNYYYLMLPNTMEVTWTGVCPVGV